MPEISVIVPVYKVEKYLDACVDSILNQTFTDFELILVDDGSPDNCGAICDKYAALDGRVRVIHQNNAGLSSARNAGVDAATGRYICFVDSDDLVAPDYCRELYGLLDGTEYDFSFCGVCRFRDGSEPRPKMDNSPLTVTNTQYAAMQLEHKTEFGVWNKLFRRELFNQIRFAPGKVHEDVIFSADLLRILHRGIVATEQQLYYYRQREGSIVSAASMKCSPDRVYAGEYMLKAIQQIQPALMPRALYYAVHYPWMFVDPIYVNRTFRENKVFLDQLQYHLRTYLNDYQEQNIFTDVLLKRMSLFTKSRFLYGFNAYTRLVRVYIYHLLGKNAYADGHGI